MPATLSIVPQRRRKGKGWTACAEHQASRFAIMASGASAPVATCKTKAEAVRLLRRAQNQSIRRKIPTAGQRWSDAFPEGASKPAIASSLTKEEYEELRRTGQVP